MNKTVTSTVKPLPGEALGSLLVRCAWSRGETAAQLVRSIWKSCDLMTRDVDRAVSAGASNAVANAFALPLSTVLGLQLESWMQARHLDIQHNGYATWITPVGVYHRDHLRYGQLYCARCLDAQLYCRIFWRLSHCWICEEHGEYLHDACSHCDMPFVPYRHDSMILKRCRWCWRRIDHGSERIRPSVDEIAYQRYVRSVVDDCSEFGQVARREICSILTGHATNDPRFKRAGEPWSWWRIADRVELFRAVEAEIRGLPKTVADPVCGRNIRQKRNLAVSAKSIPANKGERRSYRARRLLQSALRYQPFRKVPARVGASR